MNRLGLSLFLAASLSLPAADEGRWRLTAQPENAALPQVLDLGALVLPETLEKGVRVFAGDRELPCKLHPNGVLAIAPAPEAKEFTLRFGFEEALPADRWEKTPEPAPPAERLKLSFFGGRQPATPEQYLQQRTEEHDRRYAWQETHIPRTAYQYTIERTTGFEYMERKQNFRSFYNSRLNLLRNPLSRSRHERFRAHLRQERLPSWCWGENELRNAGNRLKWHFEWSVRERDKYRKERAKIATDAPEGPGRELLELAKKHGRAITPTEVQMNIRPPETHEFYSARFHGFLVIPVTGEYDFRLQSNHLSVLRLDDDSRLRIDGDGSGPVETKDLTLKLEKGSHAFELLTRVHSGAGQMQLRVRPPGETEFRLLTSEFFSSAPRLLPVRLEETGEGGLALPLIRRDAHCLLFSGKRESLELQRFEFLNAPGKLKLRLHDKWIPVTELPQVVAIPREGETACFVDPEGRLPELPVRPLNRPEEMQPVAADLNLRAWLPEFLYDNEYWEATLEVTSKLPLPLDAELFIEHRNTGERIVLPLRIPAKPDERFERFDSDVMLKLPWRLGGTPMEAETYDLTLAMPGFTFATETVRFLPMRLTGKGLISTPRGLAGGDGSRVIPVLHRPSLSERRSWELPRKLAGELKSSRRLLCLAENFGGLEERLRERLGESGRELEFVPIAGTNRPLSESLPEILTAVEESGADRALLLIPCRLHTAMYEPWELERHLAALLEKLKRNPRLVRVHLAFLPERDGDERSELRESLTRLAREYDVQYLELNQLEPEISRPESYALPGRPGEASQHPVGVVPRLSELLSERLR